MTATETTNSNIATEKKFLSESERRALTANPIPQVRNASGDFAPRPSKVTDESEPHELEFTQEAPDRRVVTGKAFRIEFDPTRTSVYVGVEDGIADVTVMGLRLPDEPTGRRTRALAWLQGVLHSIGDYTVRVGRAACHFVAVIAGRA